MFYVGQKVVCVNDDVDAFKKTDPYLLKHGLDGLGGLTKGSVYTINRFDENGRCIHLNEIVRGDSAVGDHRIIDYGFDKRRFRPATDISMLEQIAVDVTAGRVLEIAD